MYSRSVLFEIAAFDLVRAEGEKNAWKTACNHELLEEESHRPSGGGFTETQLRSQKMLTGFVTPPLRERRY